MADVCMWLLPALCVLRATWNSEVFKSCKNRALEIKARCAVQGAEWCRRFEIVFDLMIEISAVRTWGSGCPCHEADRRAKKNVSCVRQGKRLASAVWRLTEFLKLRGRCAAGGAEPDHVCDVRQLSWSESTERAFAWKMAATLADRNCDFYRNQPYSLAAMQTAADLKVELDKYLSTPAQRRHRVSDYWFKPVTGTYYVLECV